MRIWVLTNEYEGNIVGGLGTVSTQLSQSLANKIGMEVVVLCKSAKSVITIERKPSLTVIRFPRKSIYHSVNNQDFNVLPIVRYMNRKRFEKPDIIQVHSLQCERLARFYKRKFNIPIIYTCHSLIKLEKNDARRFKVAAIQRRLFRTADAITTPSLWQKRQIQKHYPSIKKEIVVLHNGVHMIETRVTSVRRNRPILFVGRLNEAKGIKELIIAVNILKKTNKNVQLRIVSGDKSGYRFVLKRLIRRLGLIQHVKWLKQKKYGQLQKMYAQYGCVVVPSRHESFGLVALEAMASGTPLVSTRNSGLASFVDNSNATIIHGVKPLLIAQSVRRMWNNPNATIQKSDNAKRTAERYNWDQISMKYIELFRRYSSSR